MSVTTRKKDPPPVDPRRDAIMRTLSAGETESAWNSRSVGKRR
jgi:hypothetical protein